MYAPTVKNSLTRLTRPTEKKQKVTKDLTGHTTKVQEERDYYRTAIDEVKQSLDIDDEISHATFDFAQQLQLPCHTREVEPL